MSKTLEDLKAERLLRERMREMQKEFEKKLKEDVVMEEVQDERADYWEKELENASTSKEQRLVMMRHELELLEEQIELSNNANVANHLVTQMDEMILKIKKLQDEINGNESK